MRQNDTRNKKARAQESERMTLRQKEVGKDKRVRENAARTRQNDTRRGTGVRENKGRMRENDQLREVGTGL